MPTSQKSSRYTIEALINAWIDYNESRKPNSKLNEDNAYQNFYEVVANNVVHLNEDLIETTVSYLDNMLIHYNYEEPLKKGLKGGAKKKQNDRVKRILPESWLSEGIWTFNLRSLKHFIELRGSGSAYYGIREVVEAILEQVPHKYRVLVDKKYRKELKKGNSNDKV